MILKDTQNPLWYDISLCLFEVILLICVTERSFEVPFCSMYPISYIITVFETKWSTLIICHNQLFLILQYNSNLAHVIAHIFFLWNSLRKKELLGIPFIQIRESIFREILWLGLVVVSVVSISSFVRVVFIRAINHDT